MTHQLVIGELPEFIGELWKREGVIFNNMNDR